MKSGNLNFLEPSGPLQAYNGTALPLPLTLQHVQPRLFLFLRNRVRHQIRLCLLCPRHGQIESPDMTVGWIRKFEPSGSVTDMVHGALKIMRTEESLDRVKETPQCSPRH